MRKVCYQHFDKDTNKFGKIRVRGLFFVGEDGGWFLKIEWGTDGLIKSFIIFVFDYIPKQ